MSVVARRGDDTYSKTDGTLEERACLSATKDRREWPAYQTADGKTLSTCGSAQREQMDMEQMGLQRSQMARTTQVHLSESWISYKRVVKCVIKLSIRMQKVFTKQDNLTCTIDPKERTSKK